MSCHIYEIWDELCSKLFVIAPCYQSFLAPPTSVRAIDAVQENLGVTIPRPYGEFLQIHNGTRGEYFLAFEFSGILDVRADTYSRRKESLEDGNRQFEDGGWDQSKLMIGDNQCGWELALDCESGRVFAHQRFSSSVQLAECFEQYLLGILDNLKSKHFEIVNGKVFMLEFGVKWGA